MGTVIVASHWGSGSGKICISRLYLPASTTGRNVATTNAILLADKSSLTVSWCFLQAGLPTIAITAAFFS